MKNVKYRFKKYWSGKGLKTGAQYRVYAGNVVSAPVGEFPDSPNIERVKTKSKSAKKN